MRPPVAAALADRYAAAIRGARTFYETQRPFTAVFFDFHERSALGDHRERPGLAEGITGVNRMGQMIAADLIMTGQDVGALALWDRHRTVMSIDPDLWEDLGDADDDTVLPEGLFRQLPYPDPFVAFPEPITLPLSDGGFMTVGGFFLAGRGPLGQCSTHDDMCAAIGLLFGGETYRADGSRIALPSGDMDMLWTRVSLADGTTLADGIARSAEGFVSVAVDGDAWRVQMPLMVRRAVACLIYLCATNADLTPVTVPGAPASAKPGKRAKRGPRTTVVEVGFQVGAALRQWRAEQRRTAGQPTGRRVRPHVRRSHFHTYRVGPGRRETRVKWLAPIPINAKGPADRTTVHKVTERER